MNAENEGISCKIKVLNGMSVGKSKEAKTDKKGRTGFHLFGCTTCAIDGFSFT